MKLIFFSVFDFVAGIIAAHFFVPTEYYWLQHTISDLASHGLKTDGSCRWVLQALGITLLHLQLESKMSQIQFTNENPVFRLPTRQSLVI